MRAIVEVDRPAVLNKRVGARVPDDHLATSVLASGDHPLERAVFVRVVFRLDSQAALLGNPGRPFGDGPADKYAIDFEAEVIVESARGVLLDGEGQRAVAVSRRRRRL